MKRPAVHVESVERFSSRKDKVTDSVEIRINGKAIIFRWGEQERDVVISAKCGFFYDHEMEQARAIARQKLHHLSRSTKNPKKQGELF